MISRPLASRWALWAFAVALLLKAAVPLLATASAHVQGKALVEVCTVYGVATVALDGRESPPAPQHTVPHAGDECALTGLMTLAGTDTLAPGRPLPDPVGASRVSPLSALAPDACATWVARLKHGPPARA